MTETNSDDALANTKPLSPHWLYSMYENLVLEEASKQGSLRPCECDVLHMLEYEMHWDDISAVLAMQNMNERKAIEFLRSLAIMNIAKAKHSVSALSDEDYIGIKARYTKLYPELLANE